MATAVAARAGADDRPGPGLKPLLAHLVALAAILVVVMFAVGTDVSYSFDEPAAILQADRLAEGRGWLTPNPLPTIDPPGEFFYYDLSDAGPAGFATYAKHPTYPVLLSLAARVGGHTAMVLLSVFGAVAAAGTAARVAGVLRPGTGLWALWATGIGSPLLFDSQLVIAHTLAAALTGGVFLALVRLADRERWRDAVLAAVLLASVCFLRTEGLLLVLVLAGWALLRAARRRSRSWFLFAVLWAGAGGVALLTDRWLSARILGGGLTGVNTLAGKPVDAFLGSRIDSFRSMFLAPGESWNDLTQAALLVGLAAALGLGIGLRRRPPALPVIVGCGVVAVVAAAVPLADARPGTIPSLLLACPLIAVGVAALDRIVVDTGPFRWMAGVTAAFAVAVALTQYSQAGGSEWGARYLALVLPVVVPLAVVSIARSLDGLAVPPVRFVIAVLGSVALLLAGLAVRSLAHTHDRTRTFVADLSAAARAAPPGPDLGDGDRRPIVVSTWFPVGRLTGVTGPDVRGLTVVAGAELDEVAKRLQAQGVSSFVLVSVEPEPDLATLGPRFRVARPTASPRILVMEAA